MFIIVLHLQLTLSVIAGIVGPRGDVGAQGATGIFRIGLSQFMYSLN